MPETICIVVRGSGGIIGLFRSDRARINEALRVYNNDGYRLVQFSRELESNILFRLLQVLCLLVTLFLWSPSPSGMLFFERDKNA